MTTRDALRAEGEIVPRAEMARGDANVLGASGTASNDLDAASKGQGIVHSLEQRDALSPLCQASIAFS